ncbi:MAG: inositol monophosphatase family protein [Micromonosporaceae bacterium]|nr:inositol monophosphatase family protein [Micromonosporaceae bacterium]
MTDHLDLLPVATAAADLAANVLRTHQPGTVTSKGDRDMVTEVDFTIERLARAFFHKHTPHIGVLGEEEGRTGPDTDLVWVLDPVDGTANFLHGSPLCGVSLGLICGDQPVLGVIDLPFLHTRYAAVEHHGTHANGRPIQVSGTDRLADAVVAIGDYAVGDGADGRNRLRLAVTQRLVTRAQRIRMHGSAALDLAWLACGRIDATIMLGNKPWDTAAGVIIAREAGAYVIDMDGATHAMGSATTVGLTPKIQPALLDLLQDARTDLVRPEPPT